ncbi:unnamed protein product [Rhizophagus irregularis]|nr:unnamed protein product [Rhizophagus irregularis]
MWTDDEVRMLIDERKEGNAHYHSLGGGNCKRAWWISTAGKINQRFKTVYTGRQASEKFHVLEKTKIAIPTVTNTIAMATVTNTTIATAAGSESAPTTTAAGLRSESEGSGSKITKATATATAGSGTGSSSNI